MRVVVPVGWPAGSVGLRRMAARLAGRSWLALPQATRACRVPAPARSRRGRVEKSTHRWRRPLWMLSGWVAGAWSVLAGTTSYIMPVMRYLEALKSLRELDPVRALRTWLTMAGIDSGRSSGTSTGGATSAPVRCQVLRRLRSSRKLPRRVAWSGGGVQPASRVRVRMRPEARALGCGADGHRPPDRRHVELVQPARAAFRRLRRGVLRGGLVRTS